CQQGGSDPPTF
nr:immunoglobulin light chain junction region [Macaca mulatta]MOX08821.1 immunoglobulin light chain junction region [Macaca mulatta]